MNVFSDLLEPFQESAKWLDSSTEGWIEICDLPACPGRIQNKIGWSVIKITKNDFWWVMSVGNNDEDWEKLLTAKLPWLIVLRVAGEFDPKEAVAEGSFLVHWKGE